MASNQPGPPGPTGPTEGQGATNAEDGDVDSVDNACNTGTGSDTKHDNTGERTIPSTEDVLGKGEVDKQNIGCQSDKGLEDEIQADKTDGNEENRVPSQDKAELRAEEKDATKDACKKEIETRVVASASAGSSFDKEYKIAVDGVATQGHAKDQKAENINSDSKENCTDETEKKIDVIDGEMTLDHNNGNKPEMKTDDQSEIREGRTTDVETGKAEKAIEPSDSAAKGKENGNLQDNPISVGKPSTSLENQENVVLNAEKRNEGDTEVKKSVTHPGNSNDKVGINDEIQHPFVDESKDANKKSPPGDALNNKEASKSKVLHEQDLGTGNFEDEEKRWSEKKGESVPSQGNKKLDTANPKVSTSDQMKNGKISSNSSAEKESNIKHDKRTLEDTMAGDSLIKENEKSKDTGDVVTSQDYARELSGKLDEKTRRNNMDDGKKTPLDQNNGSKPDIAVQSDGREDRTTEKESERTEATSSLKPSDSVTSCKEKSENLQDNLNVNGESFASPEVKEKVENENPKLTSTNDTEKTEGDENQVKKQVSDHGDRDHGLDIRNDSNDMAAGFSRYKTAAKDKDSTEKDAPEDSNKDKVDDKGLENADLVTVRFQDEEEKYGETNNDDQRQGSKELKSSHHLMSSAEQTKEENDKRGENTTAENKTPASVHLAEKENSSSKEKSQNSVKVGKSAGFPETLNEDRENAGDRETLQGKPSPESETSWETFEKPKDKNGPVQSETLCTTENKFSTKTQEQELECKKVSHEGIGNKGSTADVGDSESPNILDQGNNLQVRNSFDTTGQEDETKFAEKITTENQNDEPTSRMKEKQGDCGGVEGSLSSEDVDEDERNKDTENADVANSSNSKSTNMEASISDASSQGEQNLISLNESNYADGWKSITEVRVDESQNEENMHTDSPQKQIFSVTASTNMPATRSQQTISRGYEERMNGNKNWEWDSEKNTSKSIAKFSKIQTVSTGENEENESSDEEENEKSIHASTGSEDIKDELIKKKTITEQLGNEEGPKEILKHWCTLGNPLKVQLLGKIHEYEKQLDMLLIELVSDPILDKNREEWTKKLKLKLLGLWIESNTQGTSSLHSFGQASHQIIGSTSSKYQNQEILKQYPKEFDQQPSQRFGQEPSQQFGQEPSQQFRQEPSQQFDQEPSQRFGQEHSQQFGHMLNSSQPYHQQCFQQTPQHYQQHPSPYVPKQLVVTVQIGVQIPISLSLPCEVHEYFQWCFCLYDGICLVSLKESLSAIGASLNLFENKAPIFMFSAFAADTHAIIIHLQHYLKETSQKFDIKYEFWDLSMSDGEEFCQKMYGEGRCIKGTSLFSEKESGRDGVWLVGHKAAFDQGKPLIKAELQKIRSNIPYVDESVSGPRKFDILESKILDLMKTKLEIQFDVKINLEPGNIHITENTKGSAEKVLSKLGEMHASLRHLKLQNEFHTFLLRSEKAQSYVMNEIKWHYKKSIQFLKHERENKAELLIFEENNLDLGDVENNICKLLFFIPSQAALCQIFCTEDGKKSFSSIVKENEGKVTMVLDEKGKACCVGTKDIEEKVKRSMEGALMIPKLIQFPSEDVYSFCKKHLDIQTFGKENNCEVHFVPDPKHPWALEIYGLKANVFNCRRKIENEIGKIATKPVHLAESFNGFAVNLIERWNKQKRCFASLKQGKVKKSFPWKKWIESRDSGGSFAYSVNFNSIQGGEPETLRIVLLPEDQGGATSKGQFQQLDADTLQIYISPMKYNKNKDIISQKIQSVLNVNQEGMKKKNMVVDCERLPEKELKDFMKLMCFTLNQRVGINLDLIQCAFHDFRPQMFPCMTSIIDDHLKNKNVEVLEWKGRCIEMDVQGGQLAQQKDFDVLVNSTSYNLVLDSGFISKSILKAAGPEIQAECKQKYKGGIHIGKLAITKGYGLQCKHVFHGCLPKYTTNEDIKSLRIMVRKCLETADDLNMESIAFPALGTGNLGYNRKDVANIIYEEVEKYEKVAIAGSLCRVCCVIFQDDLDTVTEFQKRQLQWMENHKSERSQEEVVVTTDDPQVFRDICLEVQQLQSTKVKEPPKSEISESERLGESPGKRDEEGDSNSKHFKKSSKKFEPLSDERRCLLLRTKENSKKESLVESEVKKDFENLTENIVCPFQDLKQALLQFSSTKGAEEMLQNEKMKKKYELQQFPSQAVVDLKAVVSQKMVQLMVKKGVTADIIRKNSGVIVEQKDPQSMVLSGNILEIKAAFDFLSTLLKKQEMEPKELNTGQRDEHLNIEVEKILPETENSVLQESGAREFPKEQADILPEHLQQFGTSNKTLSQVSFTPSMTMSTPSQGYQGQQPKNSAEAMPPKPQQPSPHEDKRMRCTPEELYQLQYFHGSILENAEKKWNKKKTRVEVIFLQHGIKEEVEDMLREIEQMYKKTAEVSKTFESLETFCQQKRSHDLLCYITEDKKKIVIIGNDKRKVEKTEKECEDLLASETEIEVKSEEGASTLPVFVTNEGIFVYVYRDSLLKANVDAVLCPISKSFDLRGGLPKIIADMAGASYKKKVDEILIENGKLPEHFVCTIQGGEYLICKYVVNAVTTAYATYKPEESKKYLHHLLMGSFFEAEKVGAKSIALPAICSGKMGYPKEVCANCYASSVVKYSSGITSESQGLREIHFVDQSAEMITFIESVFSNPDMIEIVDLQEQRVTTDSSLYPTPIDETGSCWLNQYLSIQVVNTPISKLKSSPIATLVYDESLKLEKSAFEAFRSKFKSGKSKSKSQVGDIEIHQQHDLSKSFIKIMHVVLPTWSNKNPILDTFCKDLSLCFAKIFEKAIEESLFDLTLPLYGTVKGNAELTKRCATCLLNEVMKFGEKLLSFKKSCSILIANEDKSVHDIMFRELEGLVESEQAGFSTSRSFRRKSKARQLPITPLGDQPKGTIHSEHTKSSLKGFEDCGTIELHVRIPNGRQQGQNFVGRKETIYIPDNPMGVKVAKKLIAAFNLKILYTVKTQGASKVEMVQHTDIPLKTSGDEYPDRGYLQKVLKVLNSKIKD